MEESVMPFILLKINKGGHNKARGLENYDKLIHGGINVAYKSMLCIQQQICEWWKCKKAYK